VRSCESRGRNCFYNYAQCAGWQFGCASSISGTYVGPSTATPSGTTDGAIQNSAGALITTPRSDNTSLADNEWLCLSCVLDLLRENLWKWWLEKKRTGLVSSDHDCLMGLTFGASWWVADWPRLLVCPSLFSCRLSRICYILIGLT
jgi:hypothetical protein